MLGLKIAFYYHITLFEEQGNLFVPSYLGVFIDTLARELDTMYLLLHRTIDNPGQEADYALQEKNIVWIDLGIKTPAWHRAIFHRKILKHHLRNLDFCDALIARSPTPLAPYFSRYLLNTKLIFMIVGDYGEEAATAKAKTIREWFVWRYIWYNDVLFRKNIKKHDILVNSPLLFRKYHVECKSIHQIRTTTLSIADFSEREDTCLSETIELLYTGRIDLAKGLLELVRSVSNLRQEGYQVRLNIVGWESDPNQPVQKLLVETANTLGIPEYLVFHGKKTVGPELNAMYRMADIYVIPSYHEGFPRTIWEAMANSLPVIATHVGGIPETLVHKEEAYLIAPKSEQDLTEAIKLVIKNGALRKRLITNGYVLAKENTLEIQSKKIVSIVADLLE